MAGGGISGTHNTLVFLASKFRPALLSQRVSRHHSCRCGGHGCGHGRKQNQTAPARESHDDARLASCCLEGNV